MRRPSLSMTLLDAYDTSATVQALSLNTGLSESAVITRLCAASRHRAKEGWAALDEEGGLGVQWEFVYWRG